MKKKVCLFFIMILSIFCFTACANSAATAETDVEPTEETEQEQVTLVDDKYDFYSQPRFELTTDYKTFVIRHGDLHAKIEGLVKTEGDLEILCIGKTNTDAYEPEYTFYIPAIQADDNYTIELADDVVPYTALLCEQDTSGFFNRISTSAGGTIIFTGDGKIEYKGKPDTEFNIQIMNSNIPGIAFNGVEFGGFLKDFSTSVQDDGSVTFHSDEGGLLYTAIVSPYDIYAKEVLNYSGGDVVVSSNANSDFVVKQNGRMIETGNIMTVPEPAGNVEEPSTETEVSNEEIVDGDAESDAETNSGENIEEAEETTDTNKDN